MKIAITGANSSVGRILLAKISENPDIEALACVRTPGAGEILPQANNIRPHVISYDNVPELAEVLSGVDITVHLAGILIETRNTRYESANVAVTAAIVDASKQAGVKHLVFISVVGASAQSGNRYFKSKGDAEQLIADSGIPATIIRTPILLGPGTAGAGSLFWAASQSKAKLLGGGRYTMRPLDVDDLCQAILNSCDKPAAGVNTHELVGPEPIPYHQLLERVAGLLGNTVTISTIPVWSARIAAAISSRIKGGGISPTVIDVITMNETVEKNADEALGVRLTPLAETLEKIMDHKKP